MKTKYPYKFAAKTSIAWTTLTLILAGCGQIHSSKGSGNSAGTSPVSTDNVSQKQTSSLALQLPGSVPAQVDQVKVTLTELQLAVGAPCSVDMNTGKESCPSLPPPWTKTYTFSTKDQTLKIDDLKPLSYHIAIDLLNAKSGKVYEHGDASVIIESNKTATAHIALSNVSSDNGSLTITIGDAKNAPGSSNSGDIPQKDKPQTSISRLSYTATFCELIKCSPEHQKNICATNVTVGSDCAKAGDTCYLPDLYGGTVLTCSEVEYL